LFKKNWYAKKLATDYSRAICFFSFGHRIFIAPKNIILVASRITYNKNIKTTRKETRASYIKRYVYQGFSL